MGDLVLADRMNGHHAEHRAGIDRRGVRPRELAKSLGVAPNVVYAAIGSGELKVWRFGRAIVVQADAVEAWLAAKAA